MYKIINQAGGNTEILLYSLIHGGTTAQRMISQLQEAAPDSVTLRINSDGGEIFDAIALYNYLRGLYVHVIIDGICASAASIVAMSGKKITMKQGSLMMIHNPLTFAAGDSEDLRFQAEILDKVTESIASIYAGRTGKEQAEILDLMKSESWMNEQEALNAGFVDEIETPAADESAPQEIPGAEIFNTSAPVMQDGQVQNCTPSYDDGIAAERARLRALDELYAPGREVILNEAKYITHITAEQAALDILKAEAADAKSKPPVMPLNAHTAKDLASRAVSAMAEYINTKRGY